MTAAELFDFSWVVALIPAAAGAILLRRPVAWLLRLLKRSAVALAALVVLEPIGGLLGVTLGVNWVNALVLGFLGVPGFGLLLMLQWLLGS